MFLKNRSGFIVYILYRLPSVLFFFLSSLIIQASQDKKHNVRQFFFAVLKIEIMM